MEEGLAVGVLEEDLLVEKVLQREWDGSVGTADVIINIVSHESSEPQAQLKTQQVGQTELNKDESTRNT